MNITVFLGAPGSGKGTQAKRLSQNKGFRHFSTGDMLRAAIQAGTEVGKRAKGFMDRGELVPDSTMIEIIENALSALPADARVLLDGFPRTVPQAEALDKKSATTVNRAVYFIVPEQQLIQRLTGRRICEKCGEPYHIDNMAPKTPGICDRCGGRLMHRSDDTEEVVRRRLQVFAQQNDSLLNYYESSSKLSRLVANKPVDEIQGDLVRLLH